MAAGRADRAGSAKEFNAANLSILLKLAMLKFSLSGLLFVSQAYIIAEKIDQQLEALEVEYGCAFARDHFGHFQSKHFRFFRHLCTIALIYYS